MKLSVEDARTLALALNLAADKAMENGEHEVEVVGALQAIDDAARDDLQKAIDAARTAGA
jgi:magnesium-transporting ATPase (P-type)